MVGLHDDNEFYYGMLFSFSPFLLLSSFKHLFNVRRSVSLLAQLRTSHKLSTECWHTARYVLIIYIHENTLLCVTTDNGLILKNPEAGLFSLTASMIQNAQLKLSQNGRHRS